VHPARIERVELEVVGFQVGIGGELQKEGEPVIASGFSGDVQAVAVVLVKSLEQQAFGERVTWEGVVKALMGLDEPAIGKEQAEICPLLAEVDANL